MQRKNNGFSLIEVLIVFSTLGIVAALVIPPIVEYYAAKEKLEQTKEKLRQVQEKQQELVKPLPVGSTVLVKDVWIGVTVRNPQPVTNARGETFQNGASCWAMQDSCLESIGAEGESTLFRVKDYREAPESEGHPMACPVSTAFFLSKLNTRVFVEYTAQRTRLKEEARIKEQREREAAERLLREYEQRNR